MTQRCGISSINCIFGVFFQWCLISTRLGPPKRIRNEFAICTDQLFNTSFLSPNISIIIDDDLIIFFDRYIRIVENFE